MCDKVIEVEAELVNENNMQHSVNRKVWQVLWDAIIAKFGIGNNGQFINDIFECYPYRWDEGTNNYHFHHKPSGLKIRWYKYPLREAYCNMDIDDSKFVDILYDCTNSLGDMMPIKIINHVDKWWITKQEQEDNE